MELGWEHTDDVRAMHRLKEVIDGREAIPTFIVVPHATAGDPNRAQNFNPQEETLISG
jgi:hypothetical protein